MIQSRTHNCGELRLPDIGKTVTLVGWMENMREVGSNLGFVVLRDFYGTTQIVLETEEKVKELKAINKESTIQVTGVVRERSSKNPNQDTGSIEVVPSEVKVLGRCRYNELPFEINHSREADENARLKYRYLDLRNPEVKKNIILRCNVIAALRKAMMDHDFLEITTPILTASSPEGARDYLVPARKHPGKFYALPQAPQQFKQLLMTSGFDRYFQIAPCFRDEDARGDRSPGEFYQLDMEMAFATQEDVFSIIEDVLPPIFAEYGTYNRASGSPFARIPYLEAMEKYGTDKPDLRIDLTVQDATDVLKDCGFPPFAGKTEDGADTDVRIKAVVISDFKESSKVIDKNIADIEFKSEPPINYDPVFFKVDDIAVALVPISLDRFKETYDMCNAKSKVSSEYRPTIKNLRSGETFDLVDHIHSCIPKGTEFVYMKPITNSVKIFTVWDANNYVRGTEGDYIAIRENDLSDFYIVEKDLFSKTYEPADK